MSLLLPWSQEEAQSPAVSSCSNPSTQSTLNPEAGALPHAKSRAAQKCGHRDAQASFSYTHAHTLNNSMHMYVCMCVHVCSGMSVEVSGQPKLSVLTSHLS